MRVKHFQELAKWIRYGCADRRKDKMVELLKRSEQLLKVTKRTFRASIMKIEMATNLLNGGHFFIP
ncbi:hypothetical protein [Gottfriedia acidiceleris]|uniref:hypothetical protein n=1 Tax=Gottfriedia acidiceleris TaxID=371036 RepID=UPI003000BECB